MAKILYPLMLISGIGLFVSAIANIASVLGMGKVFEKIIWILHFGTLAIFFPAAFFFLLRFKKQKIYLVTGYSKDVQPG
jgi:hypothetical protein